MNNKTLLSVHDFLHTNKVTSNITIKKGVYKETMEIMKADDGSHYMVYQGITLTKQDPNQKTLYGCLASKGHRITWGKGIKKIRIFDGKIFEYGNAH